MATSYSSQLEESVNAVEEKADRIERAKNTEQKVDSATDSIKRITVKLDDIDTRAEELSFYVSVLEEVFDGDRSDCAGLVDAIDDASQGANIKDEEILTAAEKVSFAGYYSRLDSAENSLDDAIDRVKNHIEDEYIDGRAAELNSAKELNSIIGGQNDDFVSHIRKMQSFLRTEVWNTSTSISSLSARWDRLKSEWEEHSSKQGWETFQREHGLSDSTIEDLKQFTGNDPVRLADLSIQSLEEIKEVDELESALQVELRS